MSVMLEVRVTPQSGRRTIQRDTAGRIKIFLQSPPEQGKANHELITFLAERLAIARNALTLIAGHTARIKRIQIEGFATVHEVLSVLGIAAERQLKIS